MGGYQIHHKELGIFQGLFMGVGFWHPTSQMPEQGFLEFCSFEDAEQFVKFICSKNCIERLDIEDITIEDFDIKESQKLIEIGMLILTAERIMPIGEA